MASKTSFAEVLKYIEPPVDLDKVITCKLCGQPMHWFKVNDQIGFWIHRGKDVQICAAKNPMDNGKPMIAQWMGFYRKTTEMWNKLVIELAIRQNPRKRKKLPKL